MLTTRLYSYRIVSLLPLLPRASDSLSYWQGWGAVQQICRYTGLYGTEEVLHHSGICQSKPVDLLLSAAPAGSSPWMGGLILTDVLICYSDAEICSSLCFWNLDGKGRRSGDVCLWFRERDVGKECLAVHLRSPESSSGASSKVCSNIKEPLERSPLPTCPEIMSSSNSDWTSAENNGIRTLSMNIFDSGKPLLVAPPWQLREK